MEKYGRKKYGWKKMGEEVWAKTFLKSMGDNIA